MQRCTSTTCTLGGPPSPTGAMRGYPQRGAIDGARVATGAIDDGQARGGSARPDLRSKA